MSSVTINVVGAVSGAFAQVAGYMSHEKRCGRRLAKAEKAWRGKQDRLLSKIGCPRSVATTNENVFIVEFPVSSSSIPSVQVTPPSPVKKNPLPPRALNFLPTSSCDDDLFWLPRESLSPETEPRPSLSKIAESRYNCPTIIITSPSLDDRAPAVPEVVQDKAFLVVLTVDEMYEQMRAERQKARDEKEKAHMMALLAKYRYRRAAGPRTFFDLGGHIF